MLIFFILLFVNLMVFRLYMTESVIAYGTIVALFLFTKGLSRGGTDYEAGAEGEEDSGTEGGDYLGENEGYQPGEDGGDGLGTNGEDGPGAGENSRNYDRQ